MTPPAPPGADGAVAPVIELRHIDKSFGDVLDNDVYVSWIAMVTIIVVLAVILGILQKNKDLL